MLRLEKHRNIVSLICISFPGGFSLSSITSLYLVMLLWLYIGFQEGPGGSYCGGSAQILILILFVLSGFGVT